MTPRARFSTRNHLAKLLRRFVSPPLTPSSTRNMSHRPHVDMRFNTHLRFCMGYLTTYTIANEGINWVIDEERGEHVLIPQAIEALANVKEDNRPTLIRFFLGMKQMAFADSVMERRSLKAARLWVPAISAVRVRFLDSASANSWVFATDRPWEIP
ncbi:hypothetical protein DFH09DRAFT_1093596 [Mycena vulgaris]|nr:hypothetical protein DFH09DRAFT_1093596 [Mycena vulgaris]